MRIQPVNDLYQECKKSTPGLIDMLKEDRQQWEPVFHDVVEQTLDGGEAALAEIKSRPALADEARETALAFLEGGLTAGCFGAITTWALRDAVLRDDIAGEAERLRSMSKAQLRETLASEQEHGRQVYDQSPNSDDFRVAMREAFVAGYRVGTAEALLVLG